MTRAALARAALALAALVLAACGPVGMIHGGRLDGVAVAAPVDDWSFTRDVQKIQLETHPEEPYSVNVWCVGRGPNLWVTSGGGDASQWAKNLLADARVRVRVDGKLYERRAVRVSDAAELELVRGLYAEKYASRMDPSRRASPTVFRLDPR